MGLFRSFRRSERGTATTEFVIVFPLVIMVFMSVFEVAMITIRSTMLERGLDIAVRALRLQTGTSPTRDQVRNKVCEYALILQDCQNALVIEITPVTMPTPGLPTSGVACKDRESEVEPQNTFQHGAASQLVLIRACFVADPFFPLTGLGAALTKDDSGGYQLVTASAYVGEP